MFLLQSAMNAGKLIAAQPGLTLSDPIVSILWGVFVFGEQVRGGWFTALAAASGLVMAGAVVALARSPLLSEGEHPLSGGLVTGALVTGALVTGVLGVGVVAEPADQP
jgi:hypothetical protein